MFSISWIIQLAAIHFSSLFFFKRLDSFLFLSFPIRLVKVLVILFIQWRCKLGQLLM